MSFQHVPHPHIRRRQQSGAPKVADGHTGLNGRIAVVITTAIGSMWCAYFFSLLALTALPAAWTGGLLPTVQWVSQTFIQLVALSIIIVGQNIQALAADKRSEATYLDAEAVLHEAQEIQRHLHEQDATLVRLITRMERT